jgi:hypothetical protein
MMTTAPPNIRWKCAVTQDGYYSEKAVDTSPETN